MNTPWKYISLNQVMASVKSDLNLYDDADMIDEDRVIKIIAECNEKLGQRIYKSRECKIQVFNFKAELPKDLYKIENMFATTVLGVANVNPSFGAQQVDFSPTPPKDLKNVVTYGKMGCVDSCNNCYWITDTTPTAQTTSIQYETVIPLQLSSKISCKCMEYSPCHNKGGQYKVDLDDEEFVFSFKEGEIYMCYLGNLIADDGQIEIPFHPKLNSYYEYAIKEKILEDVFINSDSDVIRKLQYFTDKKREAYAIAWDFANSKQVNEWNKIQKTLQREYYNKWYKMYN